MGILLTIENRRWDWQEAIAGGRVVLVPYYTPPFFMFNGSAAAADAAKRVDFAYSGSLNVHCMRAENPAEPGENDCRLTPSVRDAGHIRRAVLKATSHMVEGTDINRLSFARSDDFYDGDRLEGFLRRVAGAFHGARMCIVPPGDSAVSSRIAQAVFALCIPGAGAIGAAVRARAPGSDSSPSASPPLSPLSGSVPHSLALPPLWRCGALGADLLLSGPR